MHADDVHLWQKAPALKLLAPLMAGIVLQQYLQLSRFQIALAAVIFITALVLPLIFATGKKFRLRAVQGLVLNLLVATSGMAVLQVNDIRNHASWFARTYRPGDILDVRLEEPLSEKPNSYKATASVRSIMRGHQKIYGTGKLILYFRKDSLSRSLGYGSRLFLHKPVQEIKPTGNPAAFDYQRYCLFQGITHQAYVTLHDFRWYGNQPDFFRQFIFKSRAFLINTLQQYISGEKERGLAEALLIGYKNDLDKTLLQSYANTGVVHVIAISGLHLGLIYGMLLLITKPMNRKGLHLVRACLIISGLWIFSLLAGAQPSVLRSALMFSAVALSVVLQRKTSIYNTLALSALLLLCYQPFWLWDLGFQLSYTALLSILVFFRPVYQAFYFQNKAVDALWKLAAVTIAAQILTTPLSLYHFHQFPILFLVANLLAVPLSGMILIGLVMMCTLYRIPVAAKSLGNIIESMIEFLNRNVAHLDQSGLSWTGISINLVQTILLYLAIGALSFWLFQKNKKGIWIATCAMLHFMAIRSVSFTAAAMQKKLIIYHVPGQKAVDLIDGRNCMYLGDRLSQDALNFHIKQSRILNRVQRLQNAQKRILLFCGKRILLLDQAPDKSSPLKPVDIMVLSGKPFLHMDSLQKIVDVKQVVIDSSVPYKKARIWKLQCKKLNIPCHNVLEDGAFVINFQRPTFAAP